MLTIQTVENIKSGSKLTLFNGIYAIVMGILYFIFLIPITKMNLRKIDIVWQVFSKYNPELNRILFELMILKGIFIIAVGIIIIYLSSFIIKKKDKAAWIILFVIGLIFWPSLLTFEILDKNIYTIAASFIGWLTFIIGMLIPLKYYLQKEYPEY
jgi:hypothetical protein